MPDNSGARPEGDLGGYAQAVVAEPHGNNGRNGHAPADERTGTEAQRLFKRRGVRQPADYFVAARPRDESGQVRPRLLVHERPLPDPEQMRRAYETGLARMARYRPLRAARLYDLIGRAEASLRRYRQLRAEVEEQEQNHNEEARRSDEWIDRELARLREERARVEGEYTGHVDEHTARWYDRRAVVATLRAALGLPVAGIDSEEDGPEGAAASLPPGASRTELKANITAQLPSVTGSRVRGIAGVGQFLGSLIGHGHLHAGASSVAPAGDAIESGADGDTQQPYAEAKSGGESNAAGIAVQDGGALVSTTNAPLAVREDVTETGGAPRGEGSSSDIGFLDGKASGSEGLTIGVRTEFPMDEGLKQARPEAAIAVEHGLAYGSAAVRTMEHQWPGVQVLARTLALLACGAIFGLSVGVLVHLFDLKTVALRPEMVAVPIAIVVCLGIAIFWVIGKVAAWGAALVAEEMYNAMFALRQGDRNGIGRWLLRAARLGLVALLFAATALVAVEATVERFGVVSMFLDRQKNASIALGRATSDAASQLSPLTVVCLVLVVSLPFVLFHLVEGWIEGRDRCIRAYVAGLREAEAWDKAQRLFAGRERLANELAQRQFEARLRAMERHSAPAVSAPVVPATTSEHNPTPAALSAGSEDGAPAGANVRATVRLTGERRTDQQLDNPEQRLIVGSPDDLQLRMSLASLIQQKLEADYKRREAMARRQDALAWYDSRMQALEEQREPERAEMLAANRDLLEDAYGEFVGAIQAFDEEFAAESRAVEKLMGGGILYRVWRWLFRKPEPEGLAEGAQSRALS